MSILFSALYAKKGQGVPRANYGVGVDGRAEQRRQACDVLWAHTHARTGGDVAHQCTSPAELQHTLGDINAVLDWMGYQTSLN